MTAYSDLTRRLGDGIEEAFRRAQDAQVGVIRRVRSRLGPRLPALPDPLARRLPEPGSIARANFRLAARVLKAQESYTLSLIEAARGRGQRRAPRRSQNPTAS